MDIQDIKWHTSPFDFGFPFQLKDLEQNEIQQKIQAEINKEEQEKELKVQYKERIKLCMDKYGFRNNYIAGHVRI